MAKLRKKKSSTPKKGVFNSEYPSEVYKNIQCRIGYLYTRLQVDGTILPCCVSNFTLGSVHQKPFNEIWFSDSYTAFREKTAAINKEHFHLSDANWAFCQQCSHVECNVLADKKIKSWSK